MEDQQCSEDIQPTRGQVNPKEEERTYNIAAGLDDIVEMEAEPTTVSRPAHVSPKEEVHEFIRDDVDEITAEPSPPTRVNPKEELQEFAADEIVEIQSQPVFVSEPVRLRAKEEAQEFTIADDMGLAARVKAEPVLMSLQEDAADEIVEIKSEPVFVSEPVRLRAKEEAQEFTIADGIGMGLAARVKAEPVLMTLQEDDMDMDSESDSGDDDYEEVETFHVLLEMPELEGTPCSLESTPIRLIGLEEVCVVRDVGFTERWLAQCLQAREVLYPQLICCTPSYDGGKCWGSAHQSHRCCACGWT